MRRLHLLVLIPALALLSGCVVAPVPGYYAPPAARVYVAPRPYPYYYRPHYGYGYGWRRW
jgi:hypothetical protein